MADVFPLGKVLYDRLNERDAIHVALIVLPAGEQLARGEFVELKNGKAVKAAHRSTAIGIVDPFLREDAWEGSNVAVCLFPNTVTSLRHQWTHPAFDADITKSASEAWVRQFAEELDQTYSRLMDAAHTWYYSVKDGERLGEYTYDNSETYKSVEKPKWPLFWKHFEILTGHKVPDGQDESFFTCSC